MKTVESIIKDYEGENELVNAVCEDLLDEGLEGEELQSHINDICTYGCISGCVNSMIYYKDTEKFFDEYSNEIFELLNDYKCENGCYPMEDINKNSLSWFAYESICSDLQYEIENQLEDEYEIEI